MIYVLKANEEQFLDLNFYTNGLSILEFVKDADDNWIVSENVLADPAFLPIRPQLNELERIPYNHKPDLIPNE